MKKITPALLLATLAGTSLALAGESPPPPTPETGAKNHLSVGPAYARFDYKIDNAALDSFKPRDFGGVVVAYGRHFGESSFGVHELGAQAGVLASSSKNNGTLVAVIEAPLVAAYNYNFKLGDTTRLYLGPRAGFTVIGLAVDNDSTNFSRADSALAGKFGAGIGVKQQFTKRFGMSVGYEYSRITRTDFSLQDSGTTINAEFGDMNTHLLAASFVWTF